MDAEGGQRVIMAADFTAPRETRKRHDKTGTSTDSRSKRRTVPDELRKRTGVSCDLCKKRRVKCVRLPNARRDSDSAMAPCQNCIRSQVSCESALSRKPRIYGSIKALGTRYRVLEALVKHFLPQHDLSDTRNLLSVAASLGIDVSTLDEDDLSAASPPMGSGVADGTASLPTSIEPNACSSSLQPSAMMPHRSPSDLVDNGETSIPQSNQNTPSVIDDVYHDQEVIELVALKTRTKIPERLYPNTENMISYLGPSSSLMFMMRLRQMLATHQVGSRDWPSIPGLGAPSTRSQLGSRDEMVGPKFFRSRLSKGIEGHPGRMWGGIAVEEKENDEPSETEHGNSVVPTSALHTTSSNVKSPSFVPNLNRGWQSHPECRSNNIHTFNDKMASAPFPGRAEGMDINASSNFKNYVREALPDREMADTLIEAFFDRVHPNYVLFHRGTFQLRYEAIFSSGDEEDAGDESEADHLPSRLDIGWLCSVFMVFLFGLQFLEPAERRQTLNVQRRCLDFVETILFQVINSTTLSNVQALLLVQLYRHNSCERNSSWMLLGCACRMAISLGMHRDGATGGFDPIERELRRRVWWTMYSFEQQLALTLGRPSAMLDGCEINVGLPNEGMMDGKTYMPPAYLRNSLSLTRIMTKMRTVIAASYAVDRDVESKAGKRIPNAAMDPETTTRFLHQLDTWHSNLPPNLDLDWNAVGSNHYRACHLLRLIYYTAKQIATRAYLLQRLENSFVQHESSDIDRDPSYEATEEEFSRVCLDSAVSNINIVKRLWSSKQLEGVVWLDLYYAYHSAIVLLIDRLIMNREDERAQQRRNSVPSVVLLERKEALAAVLDIMRDIRKCKTMQLFANITLYLAEIASVTHDDEPNSRHAGQHQIQPSESAVPNFNTTQGINTEQHGAGATTNSQWQPSMYTGGQAEFPYYDVNGIDPLTADLWFEPSTAMDSFMSDNAIRVPGESVNHGDADGIMAMRSPSYLGPFDLRF
jgi:proline utilization trans-activator